MDPTDEGTLEVRLYDLIHRGNPGDVAFYLEACRGARDVLEIGCGTGRILEALVGAGLDAVGIEIEPARAAAARERLARIEGADRATERVLRADVLVCDLARTFARVIAPYNVLYALLDDDALDHGLEVVKRHLAPDGRFVFDGYLADPRWTPAAEESIRPPDFLVTVEDGPDSVRVFEHDRWGPEPGRIDVTYTYHVHRPGADVLVRSQTIRHRFRTPAEFEAALARAGLRVIDGPTPRGQECHGAWFTMVAGHTR